MNWSVIVRNFKPQVEMASRELIARQERLLLRSAQLRLALTDQVQIFKRPLALADRARNAVQWLSENPLWPLSALLVLTVLKPRRVVSLGGRILGVWAAYKRMRDWSRR